MTHKVKTSCNRRKKPYPDLSIIERTVITDCTSPWSVTYSTGVACQLAQFGFNFESLAFVAWSELAGFVLCKHHRTELLSYGVSREYLSFGTVREQSGHEPKQSGLHCYEFGKALIGTKLNLVRPIRQPYDSLNAGDEDNNCTDSRLVPTKVDAVGELIMSASGLDHQTVISLETVGDQLFKCDLEQAEEETYFGKENGWNVPWVRTGIIACLSRNGNICPLGLINERMTISSRFLVQSSHL